MNWDNLRFFLAVARAGRVRAAASVLGVDQATVARRIKELEGQVGARLFRRSPDGYDLTLEGVALVPDAELAEASAAEFEKKARGTEAALAGVVRIATTDVLATTFVLPALATLRCDYPLIEPVVSTSVRLVDMARGEADIAIRSARPSAAALIIRHLHTTITALYASSGYLSERGMPMPGAAFAGHRLVMYARRDVPRHWRHLCGEPISGGTIALETDSQMLLLQAIRDGLGIGSLSRDIVAARYPDLVQVLPDRTEPVDLWAVAHPDTYALARVQFVLRAIAQEFKARPGLSPISP